MKDLQQLTAFADSGPPARNDDRAFRADMSFVDSETEMIAFIERFGVARSTVVDWRSGRFAPHPSSRGRYCAWLRKRARQRIQAHAATSVQP